jgi:hypothetical protein
MACSRVAARHDGGVTQAAGLLGTVDTRLPVQCVTKVPGLYPVRPYECQTHLIHFCLIKDDEGKAKKTSL